MKTKRPVVIISDGHSSRFDRDVLKFLKEHEMRLFILPPDTTGVTQKHDQVNQKIHSVYREVKKDLFSDYSTINRERFMTILWEVWQKWYTKDMLKAAGKRVGISEDGLNINWMQQEKFIQADSLFGTPDKRRTIEEIKVASPINVQRFSRDYYRLKLEEAEKMLNADRCLDATDVPGLLSLPTIKPKLKTTQNVRITQMHGSMTAKNAIEVAEEIKSWKNKR